MYQVVQCFNVSSIAPKKFPWRHTNVCDLPNPPTPKHDPRYAPVYHINNILIFLSHICIMYGLEYFNKCIHRIVETYHNI